MSDVWLEMQVLLLINKAVKWPVTLPFTTFWSVIVAIQYFFMWTDRKGQRCPAGEGFVAGLWLLSDVIFSLKFIGPFNRNAHICVFHGSQRNKLVKPVCGEGRVDAWNTQTKSLWASLHMTPNLSVWILPAYRITDACPCRMPCSVSLMRQRED